VDLCRLALRTLFQVLADIDRVHEHRGKSRHLFQWCSALRGSWTSYIHTMSVYRHISLGSTLTCVPSITVAQSAPPGRTLPWSSGPLKVPPVIGATPDDTSAVRCSNKDFFIGDITLQTIGEAELWLPHGIGFWVVGVAWRILRLCCGHHDSCGRNRKDSGIHVS
jgi:hypothetical protein